MTSNDKQVSFLIESLGIGGAERVVANLATEFDKCGWSVDVIVTREAGTIARDLPKSVTLIPLGADRALGSFPGLVSYLRRQQPKALMSSMTHLNVVASLAVRLARTDTTLVVTEHSMLSERVQRMGHRKEALTAKIAGLVYPWADAIVAVSDGLADDVAQVTGIDRRAISTIYNPIAISDIRDQAKETVDLQWLENRDDLLVISVGRLEVRKDFSTLLRAIKRLNEHGSCHLVLCGDGPERQRLEELSESLGVQERVSFLGWVDNPYKYMRCADVFALTSTVEGFSNVIVEALAVGCPVVSTNCPGGPSEILEDGRWGTLVPVGDDEALAAAISNTFESQINIGSIKSRAEKFNTEIASRKYIDLLGQ